MLHLNVCLWIRIMSVLYRFHYIQFIALCNLISLRICLLSKRLKCTIDQEPWGPLYIVVDRGPWGPPHLYIGHSPGAMGSHYTWLSIGGPFDLTRSLYTCIYNTCTFIFIFHITGNINILLSSISIMHILMVNFMVPKKKTLKILRPFCLW